MTDPIQHLNTEIDQILLSDVYVAEKKLIHDTIHATWHSISHADNIHQLYRCINICANHDCDLNKFVDTSGTTILMHAVKNGRLHCAQLLLNNKHNPNIQCNAGNTCLHYCVDHESLDVMEVLVRYQASLNIVNKQQQTPLVLAAAEHNLHMAKKLIILGAEVTPDVFEANPSLKNSLEKIHDIRKYCDAIKATAIVHHPGIYPSIYTQLLINCISEENISYIIQAYPLCKIIEAIILLDAADTAKLLVYLVGAHIGRNVWYEQVSRVDQNIVFFHRRNRSVIYIMPYLNLNKFATIAVKFNAPNCIELLDFWFYQGASPYYITNDGRSYLLIACANGNQKLVEYLLGFDFFIDYQDYSGNTALHTCAKNNLFSKIIQILVDRGCDINIQNKKGQTALMIACKHQKINTIVFLASIGADTYIVDHKGRSAKHYGRAPIQMILHNSLAYK